MTTEIEKAEMIQSIKAFLIPVSLFLAVIINSAGGFLVYNGYPLGWILVVFGAMVIVSAFVAFIRFQNKLRAVGKFSSKPASSARPADSAQDPVRTAITLEDPLEISRPRSLRNVITLDDEVRVVSAESDEDPTSPGSSAVVLSPQPPEPVR